MPDEPLVTGLIEMSRLVVSDHTVGDAVRRIAEIAGVAVGPEVHVGVTMLDADGQPMASVYTDVTSPNLDEAQFDLGAGPCVDAWARRSVVRVDDLRQAGGGYARFAAVAMDHGVRATLSLPLVVDDDGLGAMNFYGRRAGRFAHDDERVGRDLADVAAVVLKNTAAYRRAAGVGDSLAEAMRSRALIEQAKGMLMAQSDSLDADAAFDVLRRASQRENVKLRDIAQRIVNRETI